MTKILSLLLALVSWLPAQAAEPQESHLTLPDRLVVANSSSWVPYSFVDQEGKPRGILIDLWRLFAERNGIEVVFKLTDWETSMELVESGEADVHGGMIPSEARKRAFHFFEFEILRVQTLVFAREGVPVDHLLSLSGATVGVVKGSYEHDFLATLYPSIRLALHPNSGVMVAAAIAGELDLFVSDFPTGFYHLISMEALDRFRPSTILFTKPVQAATKTGDADALNDLANHVEGVSHEELEGIYERWMIPTRSLPTWVAPVLAALGVGGLSTALVIHFISLRRTVKFKTLVLRETVRELEIANAELERLARTDPLTGIYNRFAFFEQAPSELERARRYARPLSVAILDLDNFKSINDKFGHQTGDHVLEDVAQAASSRLRASDLFARIGGEEFAVLLPETGPRAAAVLIERVLEAVSQDPVPGSGGALVVSFSAGIAGYRRDMTLDELLAEADAELYHSKASGRARVSVSTYSSA